MDEASDLKLSYSELRDNVVFAGMIIYLLFKDNRQYNGPHVHVYYGKYEVAVSIDGELLAGSLPQKQFKIVTG